MKPYRIFVYLLVTKDITDAADRVEALKEYHGINIYAQAERNERMGIIPNKAQLEFSAIHILGTVSGRDMGGILHQKKDE